VVFNQPVEVDRNMFLFAAHAKDTAVKRDKGSVRRAPYFNPVTVKRSKKV
jgi:hypothetical protein